MWRIRIKHTERKEGGEVMQMSVEAKRARAKYMREWRRAHPEKQREYDARKWQRVAERQAAEKEARKAAENEQRQGTV